MRPRPRPCQMDEMTEYQERLRSLALNDESFVHSVLGMGQHAPPDSRLDAKTHALVALAALLTTGATSSAYSLRTEAALAAGASFDEIVGNLLAVAPEAGVGRVGCAGPARGLALGDDVGAALEQYPPVPAYLAGPDRDSSRSGDA